MAKRRKKQRAPRLRWKARCESCGKLDHLHPEPARGEFYSPCLRCGHPTAAAVEIAA